MVARKKTATQKGKKKTTAAAKPKTAAKAGEAMTIDRRGNGDRRRGFDRRTKNESVNVERRVVQRRVKVNRRRQIDPTTCERDYNYDEIEFMSAMDNYKRSSGRMFPTCSEVLEVIKSLGYEKGPNPRQNPPAMPSVDMSVAASHSPTAAG